MSHQSLLRCRRSNPAVRWLPEAILSLTIAGCFSWSAAAQENNATTDLAQAKRHLEWSVKAQSPTARLQQLAAAAKLAESAENSAPNDDDALAANELRIRIAVQQGRTEVAAGNGDAQSKSRALERYAAGRTLSSARTARLQELLTRLPKFIPPDDEAALKHRNELRAKYLKSQLTGCSILEAMGDVAKADASKKHWTAAADGFGAIYKKYRTRLVSMYARLYQSRCLRKTGEYGSAQTLLGELLQASADVKELQKVAILAQTEQMELWLAPQVAKYREAVTTGEAWMKDAKSRADMAHAAKLRMQVDEAKERLRAKE